MNGHKRIQRRAVVRAGVVLALAVVGEISLCGVAQAEPPGEALMSSLTDGTVNADLRLRMEYVDQEGLNQATAFTARLRLGYRTKPWKGGSAYVEFEGTETADESGYNAAGVHGAKDRAVIADPESVEFNQAYLQAELLDSQVRVGRQRIIMDNARFIGNVGWRQNEQTYDGVSVSNCSVTNLNLMYAYIDQANRIFGSEAQGAQRRINSDSHTFHVSFSGIPHVTVAGYGVLLDLKSTPALSSDTFGVNLVCTARPMETLTLAGRLEGARQTEAGDNPTSYDAEYLHISADGTVQGITAGVGYERLGSDRTGADEEGNATYAAFQTPLATLHAFNGWADKFLATPDEGLEDLYVYVSSRLPFGATAKMVYHDFSSDQAGIEFGNEMDVQVVKPLNSAVKMLAKYAHYNAEERFTDTDKIILEMNLAF